MPTNDQVKIEGWEELAQVIGILRGGMSEESIPSVELKTLSGGQVQQTVKVYNPDVYQAKDDCVAIFDELRLKYG